MTEIFLKSSLIAGITLVDIPVLYSAKKRIDYSLDLNVPTKLFDGKVAGVIRAGNVPGADEIVF